MILTFPVRLSEEINVEMVLLKTPFCVLAAYLVRSCCVLGIFYFRSTKKRKYLVWPTTPKIAENSRK